MAPMPRLTVCIYNCFSDVATLNGYVASVDDDVPQSVGGRQSDVSIASTITASIAASTAPAANPLAGHVFKNNAELDPPDANGKQRPKRRRCPVCTEYNKGKAKGEKRNPLTAKMCFHSQCLERC
jgi:hypothetical protein